MLDFAEANGVRLGVVTNAPRANVERALAALGLAERLPLWVVGGDVARPKPDPAAYRLALERLAADPERSLAFEDLRSGVAAARARRSRRRRLDDDARRGDPSRRGRDARRRRLRRSARRSADRKPRRPVEEARMRLTQIVDEAGKRALVVSARGESRLVKGARTTRALAAAALEAGATLRKVVAERGVGKPVDLVAALKEKRALPPIDHDDPAHVVVGGARLDAAAGEPPAWFYKGDGATLAAPGGDLASPSLALGGGAEARLVGVYLIDDRGQPVRLGFALGDEFADATERRGQLPPADATLAPSSFGPELLTGDLPPEIHGFARLRRGKEVVSEAPFAWGEQNLAGAIAALEAHHFRRAQFRRPGDVHVLFLAAPPFADSAPTGRATCSRSSPSPSACR